MTCKTCVKTKDKPITYTKCKTCGDWRKMELQEIELAKKPFRFGKDGMPTRGY